VKTQSVADVVGLWVEPEWESGLVDRCKRYWSTPVNQLPDLLVATYLDQRIAMALMIDEARRRMESAARDDSELYDGQLAEAFRRASGE
jgi:hypothetical protein